MEEPILKSNNNRFVILPIVYDKIWSLYKKMVASFWTVEEIDLSEDKSDWFKLNDGEKHFLSLVLAFFAASDGIVNENLALRFYNDLQIAEARAAYSFQIAMETIHSEMYSNLIDELIKDEVEKEKLFNAIDTVPAVAKKAKWALKWISSDRPFAERLVAFAIVEGVFFSSSFCSIFWFKKRGLLPGLAMSNELISRDEGMHCQLACLLYSYLNNKLDRSRIYEIFDEAVQIECEFACEALNVSLIGMNASLMCDYIKFCADMWIYELGYEKKYKVKNPFEFMELISLQNKENFFERRVSSYQKSGILNADENKFSIDADF